MFDVRRPLCTGEREACVTGLVTRSRSRVVGSTWSSAASRTRYLRNSLVASDWLPSARWTFIRATRGLSRRGSALTAERAASAATPYAPAAVRIRAIASNAWSRSWRHSSYSAVAQSSYQPGRRSSDRDARSPSIELRAETFAPGTSRRWASARAPRRSTLTPSAMQSVAGVTRMPERASSSRASADRRLE